MPYQIRDWDKHFENGASKQVKQLRWVPIPNKHDGKGYRRLLKHQDAVEVFCAWNLILQVASKCPERGTLRDADGDIDAEGMSDKTGFPAAIFDKAFKLLSEQRIGWIDGSCVYSDLDGSTDIYLNEGKGREGRKGRASDFADAPQEPPSKPLRKRKAPTGPHQELIEHFCHCWQERHGHKYEFQNAKDGAAAGRVLKACDDLPHAKRIVSDFISDSDAWIVSTGQTLAVLSTQINRYLAGAHRPASGFDWQPRDPTPEDIACAYGDEK